MSRWRDLRERQASAPEVTPEPPQVEGFEVVVAVVGDVAALVARLERDLAGHWPVADELPGPPTSDLVPSGVRGDARWFLVRTTMAPWPQALCRLLLLAQGVGAGIASVVPLGAVTEPPNDWLDHELGRRGAALGRQATPPDESERESLAATHDPLDLLAGRLVLRRLAALAGDPTVDRRVRRGAVATIGTVVANTPAAPGVDLALALAHGLASGEVADQRLAGRLLRSLGTASALMAHGALPTAGEGTLATLVTHPGWRISGSALDLLVGLPGRRTARTTEILLDIAGRGLDAPDAHDHALVGVQRAVACLASVEATDEVVDLLDALFASSPSAPIRRQAAGVLVDLLGDRARDVWVSLLGSTRVADIAAGERLLRRHGRPDDVALALRAAHRLLRRRDSEPQLRAHPPRGADLLAFLADHRGQRDVDALFVEVAARWERLPDDLRAWIREHLDWLRPLT